MMTTICAHDGTTTTAVPLVLTACVYHHGRSQVLAQNRETTADTRPKRRTPAEILSYAPVQAQNSNLAEGHIWVI